MNLNIKKLLDDWEQIDPSGRSSSWLITPNSFQLTSSHSPRVSMNFSLPGSITVEAEGVSTKYISTNKSPTNLVTDELRDHITALQQLLDFIEAHKEELSKPG